MRNRRTALLNLIPGFGLGYLALGRRRGFIISLLGWLVAAVAAIGVIIGFAWFIADRYISLPLGFSSAAASRWAYWR